MHTSPRTSRIRRWTIALAASLSAAIMPAATSAADVTNPAPRHERVVMDDGVALDGWVHLPQVASTRRVPTVLVFSMYWGNLDSPGNAPNEAVAPVGELAVPREPVPFRRLLDAGYAVAYFSVRGSGESGGCFDYFGARDAADGAALVDWLAAQPWSDGKIGMGGFSQDATMAMATATLAPSPLRAVVAVAPVVDAWLWTATPNGAMSAVYGASAYPGNVGVAAVPPIYRSPDGIPYLSPTWAPDYAGSAGARVCDDTADRVDAAVLDTVDDDRDAAFWNERRFTDRFPQVDAAVLTGVGVGDASLYGFGMDAVGWNLLRSHKAMVTGQWGHAAPQDGPASIGGLVDIEGPEGPPPYGRWDDAVLAWFDRYLKGIDNTVLPHGTVAYQTDDNQWHRARSWPVGRREEALHFATADRTFVSAAQPGSPTNPHPCVDDGVTSLLYEGEPLTADVELTGAPFAHLELSSNRPGGNVSVTVLELGPAFDCATNPGDFKMITWGASDLEFHDGSFDADPFPVDTPSTIRVDLESSSQLIEAGNRLAVWVSNGDPTLRSATTETPLLTVHRTSHIVLTPTSGTFGGIEPLASYPPRPNLP
jgi:putative CocE/NonD family hydrolase